MIHGTSVFSTADLSDDSGYLYGKIKMRGIVIDIECLLENEEEGTTLVRFKDSGLREEVKTSKIFDMYHSNSKTW